MAETDVTQLEDKVSQLNKRIAVLEDTLKTIKDGGQNDLTEALYYKIEKWLPTFSFAKISQIETEIGKIWNIVDRLNK